MARGDGTRIAIRSNAPLAPGSGGCCFNFFLYDTITDTFILISDRDNNEFALNTNGTRIAFTSNNNRTGENPDGGNEVFLVDTTTNALVQLSHTLPGSDSGGPSISADGNPIAFASSGDNTGGNPDLNTEIFFATCTTTPTADLALTKTDAPDPVPVQQTLTYTLPVTNNGPSQATNVRVTDTLPSGITFVSASASQGSCSGTSTVTCTLGTLASGASATVTIQVRPTATGTLTNMASVRGTETDPTPGNNSAATTTTVTTPSQAITLRVTIQGQGTVTSNPPGINCRPTCSAPFSQGTQVTLTATPASGWRLDRWAGACTGTTCTVTMDSDKAVTAVFVRAR